MDIHSLNSGMSEKYLFLPFYLNVILMGFQFKIISCLYSKRVVLFLLAPDVGNKKFDVSVYLCRQSVSSLIKLVLFSSSLTLMF